MDGHLRRLTTHTWEGYLRGYRVQVFRCGGGWYVHVMNPHGHTEACRPAASLADGAAVARAWIDRHGPPS